MAQKPDNTDMRSPQLERPSLTIDWETYAEYFDNSDLTDEQKKEFIETLWNIVVAFVDLGFGVHPVQTACQQSEENPLNLASDMLYSALDIPSSNNHQLTDEAIARQETKEES